MERGGSSDVWWTTVQLVPKSSTMTTLLAVYRRAYGSSLSACCKGRRPSSAFLHSLYELRELMQWLLSYDVSNINIVLVINIIIIIIIKTKRVTWSCLHGLVDTCHCPGGGGCLHLCSQGSQTQQNNDGSPAEKCRCTSTPAPYEHLSRNTNDTDLTINQSILIMPAQKHTTNTLKARENNAGCLQTQPNKFPDFQDISKVPVDFMFIDHDWYYNYMYIDMILEPTWVLHTKRAKAGKKTTALPVIASWKTRKKLFNTPTHPSASDSVVFLWHCALYKLTYLLTYLLKTEVWLHHWWYLIGVVVSWVVQIMAECRDHQCQQVVEVKLIRHFSH